MKIVVVGGTGLIGSKIVARLTEHGHQAVAASPNSGVNTITDVSNSPSFEDAAVLDFFTTSTTNQVKAEAAAGVEHHVALSIVNNELVPDSGYMRSKVAQERIIRESGVPYSIVRATQFFEFSQSIAQAATVGGAVRLPPVRYQPIAAEDVARAVGLVAVEQPLNGTLEIAGPIQYRFDEFIARALASQGDPRAVVADPHARYFGAELSERSLVPGDEAQLGAITYEEWSAAQVAR
jgi:uncharacterized protein YbjT (DUF2867 family)